MAAHFARENAKALGGWCRGSNANDGNQMPSGVTKNHQAIEQLERDRSHHEKIDRSDAGGVIAQERSPTLRRRMPPPHDVPADG